jgi:hypothetical protein
MAKEQKKKREKETLFVYSRKKLWSWKDLAARVLVEKLHLLLRTTTRPMQFCDEKQNSNNKQIFEDDRETR